MIHGSGNGTNAMKVAQLQNLVGHLIFHIGVDAHFGSLVLRVLHHQSTKKMVPVDLLIPKTQKRTKTLKWKVIYCRLYTILSHLRPLACILGAIVEAILD